MTRKKFNFTILFEGEAINSHCELDWIVPHSNHSITIIASAIFVSLCEHYLSKYYENLKYRSIGSILDRFRLARKKNDLKIFLNFLTKMRKSFLHSIHDFFSKAFSFSYAKKFVRTCTWQRSYRRNFWSALNLMCDTLRPQTTNWQYVTFWYFTVD